jgi:hypothetical protein
LAPLPPEPPEPVVLVPPVPPVVAPRPPAVVVDMVDEVAAPAVPPLELLSLPQPVASARAPHQIPIRIREEANFIDVLPCSDRLAKNDKTTAHLPSNPDSPW